MTHTKTNTVSGWNKLYNYIENTLEYGSILAQLTLFAIPMFSLYGIVRAISFVCTTLM